MKKIKVSIVVPVYNASKYLEECLNSIINQTYSDIEIVLIDDGSTDNSGNICDAYEKNDNRIKVYHQKNSGVSSARNNGIKESRGEYVCFVDSDDVVHPDYIKKLVENLDNDVLSICQIENFYGKAIFFKNDDDKRIELDKNQFIKLCNMYLLNTPCCKLFNLNTIRKNNIYFDTKLSLGEDLLFNLDYLKYIVKIIVTNQKLYYYRKDENNTLSTLYNPKMLEIQLLLFDRYTDFFKGELTNDDALCTFDSYRLSTLKIIVENEFRNKKTGFWQRYFKTRKNLNNTLFKSRIKSIRYPNKKLMCFLIKHKLVLCYKIINKIDSIIK